MSRTRGGRFLSVRVPVLPRRPSTDDDQWIAGHSDLYGEITVVGDGPPSTKLTTDNEVTTYKSPKAAQAVLV